MQPQNLLKIHKYACFTELRDKIALNKQNGTFNIPVNFSNNNFE